MSGARITVDGLWRCLCPSIDAAALTTAISAPYRSRPARRLPARTTCAGPPAAPRRQLHTTSLKLQDDSAQKKEGLPSVTVDARTKAASDAVTDFGDRTPAVKVDQEATKAWKGYFDVVIVEGTEQRQDNDSLTTSRPVKAPLTENIDAGAQQKDVGVDVDRKGQQDTSPSFNHTRDRSSSAVVHNHSTREILHELDGAGKDAQYGSPKINDFVVNSSSTLAVDDAGKGPSDNVFTDSFDALLEAETEKQQKWPESPDFGAGTSHMAASTVAETVSSDKGHGEKDSEGVDQVLSSRKSRRLPVNPEMAERLVQMKPPFKDVPAEVGKGDILEALRLVKMRGPRKFRRITATLLKHLLAMDPKPKALYYDMLFRAHCSPEGSVDVIADLLQEMRQERVYWSSSAYHSVLRVLAIHPDYLMRNVIIKEMKDRWIEVIPRGHRYIAIGLLRDEQYELALEKLEQMIQQGIEVDPWVFDIFIYVFGKLGFLDDALRLVRHRLDRGFEVSVNIWYFMLDVCSQGQNHEATTYIWNRTVQQGLVNPSDGVSLNILNMASVYGDTDLANQVIQYLAERGTRLSRPHYEALADSYSMQGNVERAIEVYCIMYGAGAEVNQASTGTLCQSLSRDPSLINKAVEAMAELKKKYKLPVGVFNAVLNEMIKSSVVPPEEAFIKALELYRRIREFLPTGPNWETFRILLWRCTRPDIAQFLAGEMIAFNIRQNLVIIELMFKVHVEHNGPTHRVKACFYKVAPHLHSSYAPGSRRWQNIMDLSVKVVKRLVAERDPEAWRILDICKRNGLEEDKIVALRQEVEAGSLAMHDDPTLPDAPEADWTDTRQA